MFGFGGKKKDDALKERCLQELRAAYPHIRRPHGHNEETLCYELLFTANAQSNTLKIYIPTEFPLVKPILQVVGPVVHSWLDAYKRVTGCDKLAAWTKSSSLLEVVQSTLTALQSSGKSTTVPAPNSNPPSYFQQPTYSSNSYGQPLTQQQVSPSNPYGHPVHQQPMPNHNIPQQPAGSIPHSNIVPPYNQVMTSSRSSSAQSSIQLAQDLTPMPDIPNSFPELRTMSEAQLEDLNKNETAFNAILGSIPEVIHMKSLHNELVESNVKQARETIELRQQLVSIRSEVLELQATLQSKVTLHEGRVRAESAKHCNSKEQILQELSKKREGMEDTSEDMAAAFVDGNVDLVTFLRDYIDARKEYHALGMKIELAR